MEYKTFDEKSYKIHTIKTDRFKTTKIEVFFRMPVVKEKLPSYTFLSNILNECSKKYNSRSKIAIKCEELYDSYYSCYLNKVGNSLNMIFSLDIINPELIDDPNYLEDAIKFLFEVILKPDVKNNEFNLSNFNIAKNEILLDIISVDENPNKKAINNALNAMDKNSSTAFSLLGEKEDIENITPENLYKVYLDMINKSIVDIFIIGKTDLNKIVNLIKDNYVNHHINSYNINYYIDNIVRKKPIIKKEESKFKQSYLVVLFNLINLTKHEKEIVFHVYNYLLGTGGLSSKLHKYIREENGITYHVSSMYFKYDNLLCITTALSKDNIDRTLKLIDKSINEMKNGIFSDEDLNDAKINIIRSLKINKNNKGTILNNYIFKTYLDNYTIDEKIDGIKNITKDDILLLAKKISKNTIYILSEDSNERN